MHVSDDQKPGLRVMNRTLSEWFSTLPVFLLLILTLVIGTGEMIHGQLLRMGERLFGDPAAGIQYSYLRTDPPAPDCDRSPVTDAKVQQEMGKSSAGGDDFGGLFADEKKDPAQVKASLESARQICEEKYQFRDAAMAHITPTVKVYRGFETAFSVVFRFGTENRSLLLVLMVSIAAIITTLGRHHIALRPPLTRMDFRINAIVITAANVVLLVSTAAYLFSASHSGVDMDPQVEHVNLVWLVLFSVLTLISATQIFRIPATARPGGSVGMALLTIPLFASMALLAGGVFFSQQYWGGLTIYLGQMADYSSIFLNLTLYIWIGMLLKQTRLVDMFLGILRPWRLAPETLTWLILLAAGLPTAYTGASGIFVIAAGAIIYKEVLAAGANRQYALAAAAMSGSLGVVLRPCLLIILITAMNKEVTTDQLYAQGLHVFMLTSTLFLLVSMLRSKQIFNIAPVREAFPASLRAIVPTIPYVIIAILVVLFYQYVLNTKLDEYTASMILPLVMLAFVFYEKTRKVPAPAVSLTPDALHPASANADEALDPSHVAHPVAEPRINFEQAVRYATNETISHIGALLMLMALSMSMGGLIDRTGVMELFPHHFGNMWIAMTFLVVTKVLIGMIMDPFGAVVLVSATLAPIAYANGIDPVHFWMMVLTAFELGYLLPPVALNQLLTRQVVGEEVIEAADAEVRHASFYVRYERWILPVIVMTIGLIIVSYGPFLWAYK